MAAAATGLSSLPDDLLRRILYFTPTKEGVSTAILSRRWHSLWRTSSTVNLDSRSYSHFHPGEIVKKTQVFAGDMAAALAATTVEKPIIRKLTLHMEQLIYETNLATINSSMLIPLLSSPEAAGGAAEELHFVIADDGNLHNLRNDPYGNLAELYFNDLPSKSLRVLHVLNWSTLIAPPAAVFFLPRLAELRLQRCGVSLVDLRRIIESAPHLATLHLECYHYTPMARGTIGNDGCEIGEEAGPIYRIHCPTVTDLVFEACSHVWPWKEGGLELDVPRLQYFRYKGLVHLQNRLSLKLPASLANNLIRTEFHFVRSYYRDEQLQVRFWEFLQSFNVTKVLKPQMLQSAGVSVHPECSIWLSLPSCATWSSS